MSKVLQRKDVRLLTKDEQDNLVKAWKGIQDLDPKDPDSFFTLGGYHGEPFRGAGFGNSSWWGGYCNHGNVLFPTWHRAYLARLEKALQKQVPGVTLPYWNEIDKDTTHGEGIPAIFTDKDYTFSDGTVIPNPLYSYKFQSTITDNLSPFPDADYSKPKDYETCRFPFSGLMGAADIDNTEAHNRTMNDLGIEKTTQYLNANVQTWLNLTSFKNTDGQVVQAGVKDQFQRCLQAPNYTVFSNMTSAINWNDTHQDEPGFVPQVPLEQPHDSIHLAVGGIQIPLQNFDTVQDANGDMGENDTAAFDPIFFFHHCFIDLVFWQWQRLHKQTDRLEIIAGYPGTNSVDAQGPTPGVAGGTWLSLDSALDPFTKLDGSGQPMTSKDVINITKLGYDYILPPDLGDNPRDRLPAPTPAPHLRISGISRASIPGSFAVTAWAQNPAGGSAAQLIGTQAVLSRWHVGGCANCQNHLEVKAFLPLEGWSKEDAGKAKFQVKVHTRANPAGEKAPGGRKPLVRVGVRHLE